MRGGQKLLGDRKPEMDRSETQTTESGRRDPGRWESPTGRSLSLAGFVFLLFAFPGGPSQAACLPATPEAGDTVTCTGSNAVGYAVPEAVDSVTVVIEETASVSSLGDAIVVHNTSAVTNHGEISVNGIGSAGIRGGNGSAQETALFENSATGLITVNSPGAFGIRVGTRTRTENDGEIRVLNDGSIGISSQNSSGIFHTGEIHVSGQDATGVSGADGVLFEGSGEITVSGERAIGVSLGRGSQILHAGTLTLSSASATGLTGGQNTSIENTLDGLIHFEASASDAVGLLGGDSSDQTINTGSITSVAPASVGIQVGNNSSLGINTGSMTFSAESSVGIRGGENALIVNELDAVLNLDGDSTTGLQIDAGGRGINAGSLTVTGAGAAGLAGANGSLGSPSEFSNEASGTLTVSGNGAVGIDYRNFAEGENLGQINMQGSGSVGLRAGTDSIVRNSGEIRLSGSGAIGIEIGAHSGADQSGFINVAGPSPDEAGRLISNDPEAGALIVMQAAGAGEENRIENQSNASLLANPGGFALPGGGIAIQGSSGDDVVVNAGLIQGKILLGDGNDRYLAEPGGQLADPRGLVPDGIVVDGVVLDGEAGTNTIELTEGSGALGDFDTARIRNFESIRVGSGRWQLTGQTESTTDVIVDRAGTLSLSRPTIVNGNYSHAPLPLIPQPGDPEPTLQTILSLQTQAAPVLLTTGSADLANGLLDVVVGGGFRGELDFIVLQANGGLLGEFDSVALSNDPNLIIGEPFYDLATNRVLVSVNVSGYSDNQWATSQAITGLSGTDIDPSLQALIDQVENLEISDYLSAMNQLGPEAYTAHTQATFELGHRFVQLMLDRPRFCVPLSGQTSTDPRTQLACREHLFDPWITSYGQFSRRQGSAGHISSEDNAGGLALGFDRRLNERLIISASVGTAYDSIQVDDVGPGNFTTLDLGFYAGYRHGPIRLQAVASYGHSWQQRSRNIAIGDFVGVAEGVYGVDRLGVRAELEYAIETEAFRIAPLISLDYTTLMQSEIAETGGGAAALTLPSRNETARTLRLGFDLTTALRKQGYWTALLENADGVWRPSLSVRWRQPLGATQQNVNARFSAGPSELFSVQGDDSGQGFELGVGVDWTPLVADRLTFTLRYDGFLWEGVTSSALTGRIRLSF